MSQDQQGEGPGTIVEVASRRFEVPFECPCCGATPDADVVVVMTRARTHPASADTARELEVPYCRACVAHVAVWDTAGLLSAAVMLTGVVATLSLVIAGQPLIGGLAFLGVFALAWVLVNRRRQRARAAMSPACASPSVAVTYLGWSGNTSALAFRSPTYAARFAEHNTALLANAGPELRRLLEGHRVARLAVPTPAASTTVPPPPDVRGWIEKLDRSPTRTARRHTLRAALEMVPDAGEHRQLVDAVARAELAPALTRLARLRGGARRALLDQQLARVRADNLPAALQEAELALLEAERAR